jgi:hypothetical protein
MNKRLFLIGFLLLAGSITKLQNHAVAQDPIDPVECVACDTQNEQHEPTEDALWFVIDNNAAAGRYTGTILVQNLGNGGWGLYAYAYNHTTGTALFNWINGYSGDCAYYQVCNNDFPELPQ